MTTKRIAVVESFITVGSFDCDHTRLVIFVQEKTSRIEHTSCGKAEIFKSKKIN
jgi:hypothetical protein